jgi:hypothetical protein
MKTARIRTTCAEPGGLAKVLDGPRSAIDRVAARVTGRGERFDARKIIKTADQSTPIEIRSLCDITPELRTLSGRRFGRMTVMGLSFSPGRWVVRCDCGVYTLRSAKAIRNPNNDTDCCEQCRHLLYLKRAEIWRRTGKEVEWRNIAGVKA